MSNGCQRTLVRAEDGQTAVRRNAIDHELSDAWQEPCEM
jgi:hypothetical protein